MSEEKINKEDQRDSSESHANFDFENTSPFFLEPHQVKSRKVVADDYQRIIEDAERMVQLCNLPVGRMQGSLYLAHNQITDKNPLQFFVLKTGMVIINPEIIRHTKSKQLMDEACITFNNAGLTKVMRHYKGEVKFQTLLKDSISDYTMQKVKGVDFQIFQHAIDHINNKYIFEYEKELRSS